MCWIWRGHTWRTGRNSLHSLSIYRIPNGVHEKHGEWRNFRHFIATGKLITHSLLEYNTKSCQVNHSGTQVLLLNTIALVVKDVRVTFKAGWSRQAEPHWISGLAYFSTKEFAYESKIETNSGTTSFISQKHIPEVDQMWGDSDSNQLWHKIGFTPKDRFIAGISRNFSWWH